MHLNRGQSLLFLLPPDIQGSKGRSAFHSQKKYRAPSSAPPTRLWPPGPACWLLGREGLPGSASCPLRGAGGGRREARDAALPWRRCRILTAPGNGVPQPGRRSAGTPGSGRARLPTAPPDPRDTNPAPPTHKHPSLPLPGAHTCTCAPQLQQPRRNCSPSPPCSPHSLIQQTFADRLSARRELATAAAATSHTGTPHRPRPHLSPQGRQTQKHCDQYCDPNSSHRRLCAKPVSGKGRAGGFGFGFFSL